MARKPLKDKAERKHRRTRRHPECVATMANADFDAVPPLSVAMGLETPEAPVSKPMYAPGPWLVARNGKHGHTYRIWRNDHGGGLPPAGRNEGYACISTSVWGEPNARLVSAAPDLLAAVKAMLAHGCGGDWPPERAEVWDQAVQMAEAAIGKAEGQ